MAYCVSHIGLFNPTIIRRTFDYTGAYTHIVAYASDAVDNRLTQTVNGAVITMAKSMCYNSSVEVRRVADT